MDGNVLDCRHGDVTLILLVRPVRAAELRNLPGIRRALAALKRRTEPSAGLPLRGRNTRARRAVALLVNWLRPVEKP